MFTTPPASAETRGWGPAFLRRRRTESRRVVADGRIDAGRVDERVPSAKWLALG
ncbi:hypothetical protein [Microbacterium aurantiacum]|uniref:Uncharacterized protein n=1 Tax=Microbacterium aurantiacum TaxID=162393 RepID=A0ABT8FPE4_9MICO|nr:hypothetical protein [Microbacterium chocolatum]MDN4463196.1 hypothetical protein [Microbacterium aurantiacum]